MTMTAAGVAKLIEECGELQQVCGKRLAYWTTDDHPDGTNLRYRMEEEMGDVLAAIDFVTDQLGLDWQVIRARRNKKLSLFDTWEAIIDNNDTAIDRAGLQPGEMVIRDARPISGVRDGIEVDPGWWEGKARHA